jgi:hypothetical protein
MELSRGERGVLPLVVGVTGHRDLRAGDLTRLTAEADAIFAELTATYTATPLVVLSALAEGADRLVAEAGLRHGATLIAALPMPRERYEADFTTPESREQFAALCARAAGVFVVPFNDPQYSADAPLTGDARDRRYAAGGAYMAINSDVLIALWNGTPADRVGGTGCIVEYKLQGVPEPYGPRRSPLDAIESGPVYHIVTPRRRDDAQPQPDIARKTIYPARWKTDDAGARAFYTDIYGRIDVFNRDSLELPARAKPQAVTAASLQTTADALAVRFRSKSRWTLLSIFLTVGASVVAFEIYAHLGQERGWLAVDVIGFVAAVGLFLYGLKANFDMKYQDYRALAEGLRVQYYWDAAGITDSVAANYLRKQRSELDWIRDAIRSSRVLYDAESARDGTRPALDVRLQLVYGKWLKSQADWFAKRVGEERRKGELFNELASGIFIGGLIIAFLVVVSLFVAGPAFGEASRERTVAFIALTAVIAGLLHNYAEKRAWSAHAAQYHRMQLIFTTAATAAQPLLAAPTAESVRALTALFTELGREALIENGDWLLLHRERRTDIPV